MSTPEAMGAYYENHPDPDDPTTWGTDGSGNPITDFERAVARFESAMGPPPEPPTIPGPPSPGAGMPAARIGDMCAHGGAVVGPGCPTVMIGNMVAVRAMDTVVCPMFNGPVPHVTGTILKGSTTVLIGYMPAARVSDTVGPPAVCAGNTIAMGCMTVMIGDAGGGGGGGGGGGAGSGGGGAAASSTEGAGTGGTTSESGPIEQASITAASMAVSGGEPVQTVGTGTHWIGIEMVDDAEQPVVGERYDVRLPNGKEVTGGLDTKGRVRIEGIEQPGTCVIRFPKLDLAAWDRWSPSPSKQPAPPATAPEAGQTEGPVPRGSEMPKQGVWRTVRQGQCISSIAKDAGHFWDTLWNHAQNAELKKRRGNPNILLPGDAVFIPNNRPKTNSATTDRDHKYKRKGDPEVLRIRLLDDDDQPEAGQKYVLVVDGKEYPGVSDDQGMIEVSIPGNARRGKLRLLPEEDEFDLFLGFVDPIYELSGVQARLNNLDFDAGPEGGKMTPQTEEAIRRFQHAYDLKVTGKVDEATRKKLSELHGS